jgi:hypothetical protein
VINSYFWKPYGEGVKISRLEFYRSSISWDGWWLHCCGLYNLLDGGAFIVHTFSTYNVSKLKIKEHTSKISLPLFNSRPYNSVILDKLHNL